MQKFFAEKMWIAFAVTHIFSAKNIRILCIESAKTVNEMTLNELVKLTTLWTTGPWRIRQMRKDLEAAFSRSSHSNLRGVGECVIVQGQNTSSQLPSIFLHNLLAQPPLVPLYGSNMFFHALTFARFRGTCWKPRPEAAVFNTSLGIWRMLMHWKPMFDRYYCTKTENICYISRYFLHYFHELCSF